MFHFYLNIYNKFIKYVFKTVGKFSDVYLKKDILSIISINIGSLSPNKIATNPLQFRVPPSVRLLKKNCVVNLP